MGNVQKTFKSFYSRKVQLEFTQKRERVNRKGEKCVGNYETFNNLRDVAIHAINLGGSGSGGGDGGDGGVGGVGVGRQAN